MKKNIFDETKQKQFLALLATKGCGSTQAAGAIGISVSKIYDYRYSHPEFDKQCKEATAQAISNTESGAATAASKQSIYGPTKSSATTVAPEDMIILAGNFINQILKFNTDPALIEKRREVFGEFEPDRELEPKGKGN